MFAALLLATSVSFFLFRRGSVPAEWFAPSSRSLAAPAAAQEGAFSLLPSQDTVTGISETSSVKILAPTPLQRLAARNVARRLPSLHITRAPLTEEIAARALEIFLERLDFDRTIFLSSDIEEFRGEIPRLVSSLKEGNLDFPFRVFELYKNRLRNRVHFVESLLHQPLDFSVPETYHWKRRHLPWPSTPAEWDDLWRGKVKNDVLARHVARMLQKEETARTASNAPPSATAASPEPPPDEWENLSPSEFVRKRYQQTLTIIEDHESEWVVQTYLSSFAQAYDPHTEYLSPEAQEDFDIDMKLSLSGVGAVLMPEDGFPKVVRIIPGGPAHVDGRLKAGDRIVAVAQGDEEPVDIFHWPLSRAVRLIRGPRGTKVVLSVIPAGDVSGRIVKIELIRDEVKLEEEAAKSEIHEVVSPDGRSRKIGIIRLPQFYADMRRRGKGEEEGEYRSCARDVRAILETMNSQAVAGLIFDLRNNGGGSLSEAVEMAGLFLEGPRRPVVQVKESWRVNTLVDPDPAIAFTGAVIVLVNRQSASASEIMAAALQDYGRALLVGDSKTHGKGTVQSLIPLSDIDPAQGSLKITIATFYRISGASTQLKGVQPDIVIPSPLEALEIGEEFLRNPLPWTVLPSLSYERVADLRPVLSNLAARSETRTSTDLRFAARTDQIKRIGEFHQKAEVPLTIEERLALARAERDLIEIQQGPTDAEGPIRPGKAKADLVEEEAVRILSDLLADPLSLPLESDSVVPSPLSNSLNSQPKNNHDAHQTKPSQQ